MAEQDGGAIDFNALGQQEQGSIDFSALGQPAQGGIDFEGMGRAALAGEHASALATHRWTIADQAKEQLARLQTATATGTIPTPQGLAPLDSLASGAPHPQQSGIPVLTEHFAPELTPGPGSSPATLGMNALKGAAAGGLGTVDLATLVGKTVANRLLGNEQGVQESGGKLADMLLGAAKFAVHAPAAAVGSVAEDISNLLPGIGPHIQQFLTNHDLDHAAFNDMFVKDPFNTILATVGGGVGAGDLVRQARPAAVKPTESTGGTTPTPEETLLSQAKPTTPEPVYQPTFTEAALADLQQQLKEGAAPGQAALRTKKGFLYSKPGLNEVTQPATTPSNRSTVGGGEHAITSIVDEAQLVHPDLTRAQVKAQWKADPQAVLRDIAFARAREAVNNLQSTYATADVPAKLEAQGAGGTDPTLPITQPVGPFDTSRLQEMRRLSERVRQYYDNRQLAKQAAPVAPVEYKGFQPGFEDKPGFHLYNLTEDIPGHTKGSTVSEKTLRAAGYTPPAPPAEVVSKVAPTLQTGDVPSAVQAGFRTTSTQASAPHLIQDMTDLVTSAIGDRLKSDAVGQAEAVEFIKKHLDQAVEALHQFKNTRGGFAPALGHTRAVDPAFYDHTVGDIGSRSFALYQHNQYARQLLSVLGEGLNLKDRKASLPELTQRLDFFGKIMMDDASKAVDMKNTRVAELQRTYKDTVEQAEEAITQEKDVAKRKEMRAALTQKKVGLKMELEALGHTPDTPIATNRLPQMTSQELQTEQANPLWQRAVQFHIDNLQKDLESRAEGAGVESRLYGPRGTYMPLKRYERISDAPKNAKLVTAEGSVAGPFDFTRTRTRAAKGRTGAIPPGMFVSMDYMEHALAGRSERYQSFYRRQMQQGMIDRDLTEPDGTHPDTTTLPDGRTVKVVPTTLLDFNTGMEFRRVWTPKPIADGYNLAVSKPWNDTLLATKLLNGYATAALVMMPAEATMHSLNMAAVLAATDKVGAHRGLAGDAAQWAPIVGKWGLALDRMMQQRGAHLAENMQTLAENQGLRTSYFRSLGTTAEAVKEVTKGWEKNPKEWVFGFPDGATPALEARMRSALLDVVREGEPGITNSDAVRRVNAMAGTYTTKLAPLVAKILGPIYPFSRATTALGRTGVQVMLGVDPVTGRWSPKGFLQNVVTPVAAGLLLGKMLDQKGQWSTEKPGYQTGDIMFDRNGTTYRIPLRLYLQPLYRGLTATGVRSAIDQYIQDEGEHAFKRIPSLATLQDVEVAQLRGARNYAGNLLGPFLRSLWVLGTGQVPYQLPTGDMLKVEKASLNSPLTERLKAATAQGVAPFQKLEEKGGNNLPTETGRKINRALGVLGVNIKAEPTSKQQAILASQNSAFKEKVDTIIGDAIRESRNEPPDQQSAYIMQTLRDRLPARGLIFVHGKPTPVFSYAIQESLRRRVPHPNTIPPSVQQGLRQAQ